MPDSYFSYFSTCPLAVYVYREPHNSSPNTMGKGRGPGQSKVSTFGDSLHSMLFLVLPTPSAGDCRCIGPLLNMVDEISHGVSPRRGPPLGNVMVYQAA